MTFGADNGLSLADMKGVTDFEDECWDKLMDQITLFDCMVRVGFGGVYTKPIESIHSPQAIQVDGPAGIHNYPLGQYAEKEDANDPCVIDKKDKNRNFKFGVMCTETVIGSTFSKEMAAEYGNVCGNYSLWSNLTIFWGCGNNLHRSPYNGRNSEYYSEDPVLTAKQGRAFVSEGNKYGLITAMKHFAFNNTEINRLGISTFMTEQKAREMELRGSQEIVEDSVLCAALKQDMSSCEEETVTLEGESISFAE